MLQYKYLCEIAHPLSFTEASTITVVKVWWRAKYSQFKHYNAAK